MPCVPSTPGFQPEIVPSFVAQMKRAGADAVELLTTKSTVPLDTMPVGLEVCPAGAAAGLGMDTTGRTVESTAVMSYDVETPVPLSATTNGLVVDAAMTQ